MRRLRARRPENQGVEEPRPIGVFAAEGEMGLEDLLQAVDRVFLRRDDLAELVDQIRRAEPKSRPWPGPPCCGNSSRASAWRPRPSRRFPEPKSHHILASRTAEPPPARCAAPRCSSRSSLAVAGCGHRIIHSSNRGRNSSRPGDSLPNGRYCGRSAVFRQGRASAATEVRESTHTGVDQAIEDPRFVGIAGSCSSEYRPDGSTRIAR